ncbi:hypothetical protein [Mycolicibacterium smegmatis]|uniref:hypothetical protein n=1 Tax=Mycolicibacterium smegmatis TaxID=1772 RepID=UPI001EFAF228|nr:hypothetical protein [Mycolicibacterium smegmatis]ULN37015.1 hypothetical protein KZ781_08380 [Mycolicibacterium smegmatis]
MRFWLAVLSALVLAVGLVACDTDDDGWNPEAQFAPVKRPAFGARETDGKLVIWVPPGCVGVWSVKLMFGLSGPDLVLTPTVGTVSFDRFTVGGPYPPGMAVTKAPPPDFDWRTVDTLHLDVGTTPGGFPSTSVVADIVENSGDHPDNTFFFDGVGWLDPEGVAARIGNDFEGVCTPQETRG